MGMSKEAEEKISQLQLLEQNMQAFLMQKQQLQIQLSEIESALDELKDTKKAYKIVANIMVESKREDLESDLKNKKEMVDLRIKNFEKQEEKIREKIQKIQKEVLGVMKE